ncbi:MAG: hypothetical protein LKI24_09785 [Acidipropionibacterium sp.]|nr:hypothetical protein [Acidipropionibacterium sp.]
MDDQDERWSELILELYGHRDVLVERFLAQMRLRGDYDSYGVTREDLEATAFKAYEAILRYVVESDPAPRSPAGPCCHAGAAPGPPARRAGRSRRGDLHRLPGDLATAVRARRSRR